MREVALRPASGAGAESPRPLEVRFGVGVRIAQDGKIGFTTFEVDIKGDTRTKPYEVSVEIVGEFLATDGGSVDLGEFCRDVGPTILFPYVRQVIDRLTSDGRYGAIRLDPINVRAILAQRRWRSHELPSQPPPLASSAGSKRRASQL